MSMPTIFSILLFKWSPPLDRALCHKLKAQRRTEAMDGLAIHSSINATVLSAVRSIYWPAVASGRYMYDRQSLGTAAGPSEQLAEVNPGYTVY